MIDVNEALQCPVDQVSVNENKARIIAFFALLIVLAYLVTGSLYLIAFLVPDFLLRATPLGKNSPLSLLAGVVVSMFKIKNKPTDRAPKRFAAGTGLVFTILIIAATLLHLEVISIALTIVLVFFAALESFVGFCAGCYVYSFLKNSGLIAGK
jgi:hypothetical protein